MKKIKVYELAKEKKLSNKAVIEILKRKGFTKVSAITYVDPTVLDDNSPSSSGKVSHIFSAPSHPVSSAAKARRIEAVPAPAPKPAPAEKPKKTEEKKPVKTAAKKTAEKRKPIPSDGKKEKSFLAIITAAAAIIAIMVAGMAYMQVRTNRGLIGTVNSGLSAFQSSASKLGEITLDNRAEIVRMRSEMKDEVARLDKSVSGLDKNVNDLDKSVSELDKNMNGLNQRFSSLSGRVAGAEIAPLQSRLKAETTVLRALSEKMPDPLKSRTMNLADRLSQF
jgi:cell division protein FtsL